MTKPSPSDSVGKAVKDPKKVEAGQKGAAARKAKKEQILAELREAKASLATRADTIEAEGSRPTKTVARPQVQQDRMPDYWSWVIGGLGIAGAFTLLKTMNGGSTTVPAVKQSSSLPSRHQQLGASPAHQLKPGPDPFDMQ